MSLWLISLLNRGVTADEDGLASTAGESFAKKRLAAASTWSIYISASLTILALFLGTRYFLYPVVELVKLLDEWLYFSND